MGDEEKERRMMGSIFTGIRVFLCVLLVLTVSVTAIVMVAETTPVGPSGIIHVDGEPVGMAITLDGTPYGHVPESGVLELVLIPVGNHTIGASKEGFQSKNTQITLFDGQITKVRVQLTASSAGTLEVQSVPTNVQIYLDGVYKGITPITLTGIPTGDHMVLLKHVGYKDWSSAVTITPGGNEVVSGTLERESSPPSGQSAPTPTPSSGGLPGTTLIGLLTVITGSYLIRR